MKKEKNYYKELDKVIFSYEQHNPWHDQTLDWCWKWRKITKEQMGELAGRLVVLLEEGIDDTWLPWNMS